MTDTSRACAASMVGAAIGAAVGFLFFSAQGRAFRRQLETTLEHMAPELRRFSDVVNRAASVASEGWRAVTEMIGDDGEGARYASSQQTRPF